MAIGLTRSKNLSEKNLNLKNALQKLYAPGIESDIEIFSLSSSVESIVTSGPINDNFSQIVGLSNESLTLLSGQVQKRTKFLTKFFTLTDLNSVYFSKFNLTIPTGEDVIAPKSLENGEVFLTEIISGGRGFYFLNLSNNNSPTLPSPTFQVENVILRGSVSGRNNLRAKITFIEDSTTEINSGELTKFTSNSTKRYSVQSIEITSPGSGYIFPERLEIVEGNVILSGAGATIRLRKQKGAEFSGSPEIIQTKIYLYEVRGADREGFFLYDLQEEKYIFLSREVNLQTGFSLQEIGQIEVKRFDGINIDNLLQFKFAQSRIYLRNYGNTYRIGGSISGTINSIASSTNNLQIRTQTAIQNTVRPTPANSIENILGYRYNSFQGADVVIWQRMVLRDPDYVLDPNNPDFASDSITGDKLRSNVTNFEMNSLDNPAKKIRVSGLFIKVGTDYFRAFSTTDKPFFAQNSSGVVLNPQLSSGENRYSLGAESLLPSSTLNLYSYNTTIAQLGQRINSNGKDGAFYFHRATAPQRRQISTVIGGVATNIFGVPLFTLITS
jgi:hypothetical protein